MSAGTGQLLIVASSAEADALHDVLRGAPYLTVETHDLGLASLSLPRLTPPALVVIDDSATGDLVAFLGRLQRTLLADGNVVPAVLLTAADGSSPKGISEVVTKPFEGPLLLEVLQRLLERG